MNVRPILLVVGTVLLGLAALKLVPAGVAWYLDEPSLPAFYRSALVTAVFGVAFVLGSGRTRVLIYPKQTFLITALTWTGVSLFGALPLYNMEGVALTDAVFESVSGFTATGATVLVGLEHMPRSVLLWRSMTQSVGGLGFALLAIAVLPMLGVGGMRLFKSESPEWTDKATPRMRSLAVLIATTYFSLTALCALAYWLGGMSAFDAVNHALTTISTAGYSTYDASFAHFRSPALEWVGIVFMLSGALPFVLYVRAMRDGGRSLLRDQQVRGFAMIVASVVLAVTVWRYLREDAGLHDVVRGTAFNLVSVITTTGYVSSDYATWGAFATMIFFYCMFVGGCSGSTSGGFKVFRLQIGIQVLRNQVHRQVHPNGVFQIFFNRHVIGDDVVRSLIGFSLAFFATIAFIATCLAGFDLDFMTSLTAAMSAVSNVGPGLGPLIGPTGSFTALPDAAKWLLAGGMLIGRLEVMTLVVLCSRRFWQS